MFDPISRRVRVIIRCQASTDLDIIKLLLELHLGIRIPAYPLVNILNFLHIYANQLLDKLAIYLIVKILRILFKQLLFFFK
jgi:hypothetical protein